MSPLSNHYCIAVGLRTVRITVAAVKFMVVVRLHRAIYHLYWQLLGPLMVQYSIWYGCITGVRLIQ